MLFIVLLVLFTVVMAVWFLALVGGYGTADARRLTWVAFLACLLIGVVVFLTGTGIVAYKP